MARKWILSIVLALAGIPAALAADGHEPPDIEGASTWKPLGLAVVALVAICVLAFKSSRRTHLD